MKVLEQFTVFTPMFGGNYHHDGDTIRRLNEPVLTITPPQEGFVGKPSDETFVRVTGEVTERFLNHAHHLEIDSDKPGGVPHMVLTLYEEEIKGRNAGTPDVLMLVLKRSDGKEAHIAINVLQAPISGSYQVRVASVGENNDQVARVNARFWIDSVDEGHGRDDAPDQVHQSGENVNG
jgi:hypothetical protein